MRTYSILVGKCYRTRSGEVREVSGYLNGEIIYTTHIACENGNESLAPRLSWERFAREAESEIICPQARGKTSPAASSLIERTASSKGAT